VTAAPPHNGLRYTAAKTRCQLAGHTSTPRPLRFSRRLRAGISNESGTGDSASRAWGIATADPGQPARAVSTGDNDADGQRKDSIRVDRAGLCGTWTDRLRQLWPVRGTLAPRVTTMECAADDGIAGKWFLTQAERGNPATGLDSRLGASWSTGNDVRLLIHGATYFAALVSCTKSLGPGDTLYFTDWRGDPDEAVNAAGVTTSSVLAGAASRGAIVNGLVWRSHWDRLAFSAAQNRRLGADIEAAGGCCLLDMRVRIGGSHHQKFVIVRHLDARKAVDDVAFVGGIDLCHGRRDEADHAGDPQSQPMAAAYGNRPPWHDVQVAIRGPAVGAVDYVFRERWTDPQPLSRAPWRRIADGIRREQVKARPLPSQHADPPAVGSHAVQILRTYPKRRHGYPFAPNGERSVARAYVKALQRARALIYVEDQYLWSAGVVAPFAAALREQPQLRMIAVLPMCPDQDGRISGPPNEIGRLDALHALRDAGGDRVAVYGLENTSGTPIYVHAKVCVIDDVWASVGSDNLNRRSWSHDSELSCAVVDQHRDPREPLDPAQLGDGARIFARDLRLDLAREHLGRDAGDDRDLIDPVQFFDVMVAAAERLDAWHDAGSRGDKPSGQLRRRPNVTLGRGTRLFARPLYRLIYDPDGRPWRLRHSQQF
jgi:phosphatidylserine/phosphatidylglycerophosphate/cardiolipin synthase-like enzyme